MSEDKDKKVVELHVNEALPTVFVDNLQAMKRADGMYLVRFATAFPEGLREQARVMIPERAFVQMLDVLCKLSGHFPKKRKATAKAKPKSKGN